MEVSKCVPHRKGKPHVWDDDVDDFGDPNGRMICLWCGTKAPMKKFTGMYVPQPVCAKTGY